MLVVSDRKNIKEESDSKSSIALYQVGLASDVSEHHDYSKGADVFSRVAEEEKRSLAPILMKAFEKATPSDNAKTIFDKDKHKMVDIGCGPFMLAIPFIQNGIVVHGIDSEPEMIEQAKKVLANHNVTPVDVRLCDDYNELEENGYKVAMMNFVHQSCPDRASLKKLFNQAYYLLEEGGRLLLSGAHPDYLEIPHTFCEYDIDPDDNPVDGQVYSGRIFDGNGDGAYILKGDHYWATTTITAVAKEAGFNLVSAGEIDDPSSPFGVRKPSESPAYIMMSFKRNGLHP